MSKSLVSIIIPFYNPGRFLRDAVMSALSQSYSPIEVILIDDGSTEPYAEQLSGLADSLNLIIQKNKGACSARNAGLSIANGEFVKFLDADDFLLPGSIESEVNAIMACKKHEFTVGRAYRMDVRTGIIKAHAFRDAQVKRDFSFYETVADVPVISSPLYPKEVLNCVGGFDEALIVRQDFDLYVRVLLAGNIPRYINSSSFVYRDHDSELRVSRQNSVLRSENEIYLFKKLLDNVKKSKVAEKRIIAEGIAVCAWITARNNLRYGHIEQSKEIFSLAKEIDPAVLVGHIGYKFFCRVLGPIKTELFLGWLKSKIS